MTPIELQRHLIAWNVMRGGLRDFGVRADGVRDDDGVIGNRTQLAMADYRLATGTTALMQPELLAHLREQLDAHRRLGGQALGFRTLSVALGEWCDGVREEPMGSNTGQRIREYFAICERNGKQIQTRVGEWCAAAASWCTKQALRQGEEAPHGFRIGGAELEGDLKRSGAWMPVEHVRSGLYSLRPGDLVILSRGTEAWTRHACRLVAHRGDVIWTIGGNESNQWMLTPRRIGDAKLLGFGAYPYLESDWTEEDERRVAELCPGTMARMVSEPVCR